MPLYMTQFSYTPEAWAALARQPENRTEAVGRLCQQFGARLAAFYYSFGEYDGVLIAEAPDEVTVTSILIAAIAPGHVRATKTTVLLTPEQAVEAMRRPAAPPTAPPAPDPAPRLPHRARASPALRRGA